MLAVSLLVFVVFAALLVGLWYAGTPQNRWKLMLVASALFIFPWTGRDFWSC